ncbi:hypothetical protein DFH05DRAFT_906826 [Lentinula detonsa]|uniref:Uncharacterized protein n=1 Tax=Lentinula detonsa TaxID=2804962 RepID=A0A9W8P328_9AGAR|nr:hypothetical protein DFH05DRAFT_906826 [Lentinula detonsa]
MAERYLSPWVSDDEQSLAATFRAAKELVKKRKATEQRKKLAEERRKNEEEERRRKEEEMRRTHEEVEQRWSHIQAARKEREEWEACQREREAKRQRLRELLASIESGVYYESPHVPELWKYAMKFRALRSETREKGAQNRLQARILATW